MNCFEVHHNKYLGLFPGDIAEAWPRSWSLTST